MTKTPQIVILGAGPTGLGAAYRLQQLGHTDFVLVEASSHPGGLASSVVDDHGFTWDLGGHVHFSHYREYDEMIANVLGDDILFHERRSWIWYNGQFVPYPFQHNLHYLKARDREYAIAGLREVEGLENTSSTDLSTWIQQTFGRGIAELFMIPYNRKVWGYPLHSLGANWIEDRVAKPNLQQVLATVRNPGTTSNWGPNRRFFYPKRGGTGTIWRNLTSTLATERLRWNAEVATVDLASKSITMRDGQQIGYQSLISTAPLDWLISRTHGLDHQICRPANELVYSSVHIVGVGLRGHQPTTVRDKSWIYFPGSESPFHRVTVLSNYSPFNVPEGADYWSLMAEICETPHQPVDGGTIVAEVIDSMKAINLIPGQTEVVSQWHRREERGYPTPFLHRDRVLSLLSSALETHQVYSRGRFGAWRYEVSNQDHSFMQGRELVDRLLGVGREVTIHQPNQVNRRVTTLGERR